MRIVHVIPFLWSGAGRVLTDLCLAQQARHDVTIITSGKSKGMTDWRSYRQRLSLAGVGYRCIDFFDREPSVFWNNVEKFEKFVSEWRPDVVHCHSGVPACAAAIIRASRSDRFRLIGQLHSWGHGRPEWMNTMDLWGFSQSDAVIANALSYRDILSRHGIQERKIKSIPWGVSPEAFETAPRVRRDTKSVRIGFVGRIEPRKGQLELVRAFALLHHRRPDARLELVGPVADQAYGREIEKLIRSQRLSRQVRLSGRVRNVYSRMRDWDLFVSMSKDEGQGMAVLEAMAMGVPVLARSCPGIEDYLKDGEIGVVLKSSAPANVARAMFWAITHREQIKLLSTHARWMVTKQFSLERTVIEMEELYGAGADRRLARIG